MFSIILLLLKTISNQFPAFNIQHRLAPEMFQNFVLKSYVICYNFPHSRECIVAESFVFSTRPETLYFMKHLYFICDMDINVFAMEHEKRKTAHPMAHGTCQNQSTSAFNESH